jgi:copper homeostasis protein
MPNPVMLEVCVESADRAVAAERGGAQRIELCRDLSCGGLTPGVELMQETRRQVRLPIYAMIRPRPGNFVYSTYEFEIMGNDIAAAKRCGMDGVVLGMLHPTARIDVERTKSLVQLAYPLPVTFHRAFDAAENLDTALEDVIQTGAARILTSGGQPRVTDALPTLARLVQAARSRILLMLCGGINSENVAHVVCTTLAQEVHSSVGTSHSSSAGNGNHWADGTDGSGLQSALFEQRVAQLVSLLNHLPQDARQS